MKFFASVDNKYLSCSKISVVYPPVEGDEDGLRIEASLDSEGIKVNVIDSTDEVIEAVHVLRGDLPQGFSSTPPASPEEALEELHLSLTEALEAGVPLSDLFTYMLSRASEIAVSSGMSSQNFVKDALNVYEGAIVLQTERSKRQIGEA